MTSDEKLRCEVCGKVITKEESDSTVACAGKCWDDQLTEESDSMFDDPM